MVDDYRGLGRIPRGMLGAARDLETVAVETDFESIIILVPLFDPIKSQRKRTFL